MLKLIELVELQSTDELKRYRLLRDDFRSEVRLTLEQLNSLREVIGRVSGIGGAELGIESSSVWRATVAELLENRTFEVAK